MTPGQQTLLITVDTLDEQEYADLAFITELTTRIQKRVFCARSRKTQQPTIQPAKTVGKPVRTILRPNTPTAQKVQTTKLVQKLTPPPAVVNPNTPWPFTPPTTPEQKLIRWVVDSVSVGKIVKMKDTRDGHGYRLVESINFTNNTLDCSRLVEVKTHDLYKHSISDLISINDPDQGLLYFVFSRFPTTHGMAKVVATVNQNGSNNRSCAVISAPAFPQ